MNEADASRISSAKAERVIDLGAQIRRREAELASLEEEVARLRSEFDELLRPESQKPSEMAQEARPDGSEGPGGTQASLPKRIIAKMQEHPIETYRAEDFADLPGAETLQNVRTSLVRLCERDGVVERVGRGVYKLAQVKKDGGSE